MRNLFILVSAALFFIPLASADFKTGGVIFNSTSEEDQIIALGIRPEGHMGAPRPHNVAVNASTTGIAYKFDGSATQGGITGWRDATTPGCLCEGWGAGGLDADGNQFSGRADEAKGGVNNLEVKSFVTEETSLVSTVWIDDSDEGPTLEVIHRFGPAAKVPGVLFQALVTITNIGGSTVQDVRYNRTMDWDIPPTEFSERVSIIGATASAASPERPKVLYSGNQGFMYPKVFNSSSLYASHPKRGVINTDYELAGPSDHGFTATFELGDLVCGEAHTFMIYYGAAKDRATIVAAFATEEVPFYSLGQSAVDSHKYRSGFNNSQVTYGFGFKGVSGSAIAPSLPVKTAILPGGVETNEGIVQTYAPPAVFGQNLYQAIFKYRQDKQWEGDILKYELNESGSINAGVPPVRALKKLQDKLTSATLSSSYDSGGRSIWTVGNDPNCPGGLLAKPTSNNNFTTANSSKLQKLLFSCGGSGGEANELINFVRGADIHRENVGNTSDPRTSLLGDTFHSELIFVGAPRAGFSSDAENFGKSESFYRYEKNYGTFAATHKLRRAQIYVGANDGMLHAFDEDLNERWAFIPPSVTPTLRGMLGVVGSSAGQGKSNTVFNVDGPIAVKDIYIEATSEWKTVLVGGLGYGGKSYYVLDITDPDDPKHMFTVANNDTNKTVNYWAADGTKSSFPYLTAPDHIDYQKIGSTWSRPIIMLLPFKAVGETIKQRWVMAFGGGYGGGASSGFGPHVFVLDFEPDTASTPNTTGGKIISQQAVTADPASNIPNGVTAHLSAITADGTSLADYFGGIAYFTDLQGQLWKYNLSKNTLDDDNTNLFALNLAFRAEGTLANDRFGFNQVATTVVQNDVGDDVSIFNYFGTGDQSRIQRRISSINNRIFGIKDSDFPGYTLTDTGVGKTTLTSLNINDEECVTDVTQNWYSDTRTKTSLVPEPKSGSNDWTKIIGRAGLFKKNVYFSIYRPESKSCPLTGSSQIIQISDGCGGVTEYNVGEGLVTAPVIDNRGNIYAGVSNIPADKSVGGAGVDNITQLGDGEEAEGGVDFKSWREITY